MIDKILKAKHWQLFFLLVGVPIGSILTIAVIISSMVKNIGTPPDPSEIFKIFSIAKFLPLIMVGFASLIFSWFWSVANGLQNAVPASVSMKTIKFRIFSIIPLLYVSAICVFMFISISKIKPQDLPQIPMEWIGIAILILHIVSIFGVLYTIYFAAKTLKTVELQREVSFREFASEFFMFLFFPIGIWILQPRINDIVEKQENEDDIDW
ncbi:hypothetical protein [Bernardetia sp.]|uniref:hypothetical protein n=1 Tax=Bernardetia sp. TaxID=1937974 RepID=UPI0025C0BFFE|nr:hypothetical protein [Bernardetia sp.]